MPDRLTGAELAKLLALLPDPPKFSRGLVAPAADLLGRSKPTAEKHLRRLVRVSQTSGDKPPRFTAELREALAQGAPAPETHRQFQLLFYPELAKPARKRSKPSERHPNYSEYHRLQHAAGGKRRKTNQELYAIYAERQNQLGLGALSYSAFCAGYRSYREAHGKINAVPDALLVGYTKAPLKKQARSAADTRAWGRSPLTTARLFIAVHPPTGWTYAEIAGPEDLDADGRISMRHWLTAKSRAFHALGRVPASIEHVQQHSLLAARYARQKDNPATAGEQRTYLAWAKHYDATVPTNPIRGRPSNPAAFVAAEADLRRHLEDSGLLNLSEPFGGLEPLREAVVEWQRRWNGEPPKRESLSRTELAARFISKPLPETPYAYREWHAEKIRADGYVRWNGVHYSVPLEQLPNRPLEGWALLEVADSLLTVHWYGAPVARHRVVPPSERAKSRLLFVTHDSHRFSAAFAAAREAYLRRSLAAICPELGDLFDATLEREAKRPSPGLAERPSEEVQPELAPARNRGPALPKSRRRRPLLYRIWSDAAKRLGGAGDRGSDFVDQIAADARQRLEELASGALSLQVLDSSWFVRVPSHGRAEAIAASKKLETEAMPAQVETAGGRATQDGEAAPVDMDGAAKQPGQGAPVTVEPATAPKRTDAASADDDDSWRLDDIPF